MKLVFWVSRSWWCVFMRNGAALESARVRFHQQLHHFIHGGTNPCAATRAAHGNS